MKLTAVGIRKAPDGKLEDGAGLRLVKRGAGGYWVYRFSIFGRRKEMGLGAWPAVSLADARKARDQWAAEVRAGRDPLQVREEQAKAAAINAQRVDPTFADMVAAVFEARKATLRGDGTRGRWLSPLATHIIPKIGAKPISKITIRDVQEAMAPIWHTKPAVAEKAYSRTRLVFTKARLMGYDCEPFTVEAAKELLGEVDYTPTPLAATPWQEIPALYERLNTRGDVAQCLRWIILTLVRSDSACGARFSEVDGAVWTVPKERIKGMRRKVTEFRVPLSEPAIALLEQQAQIRDDLIFAARRGNSVTSRGLEKHLDALGEIGRPHGFRTSFRTWVQDTDACSYEVAETVLNHTIHSKVAKSYARSDLLDRRAIVMEKWARFVTGQASATVTKLHK
ncbi:tyrosine-type recombinase/integrase [Roseovarius sp. D0-M9]|uniref:tyrosine-type recombinase/integrase n=1 Tax=Roseovarius sp. D0-M9 TaxID=3127117 RepID=UPI0030102C0A